MTVRDVGPMIVRLATQMRADDASEYRALLQDIIQYAVEDLPFMSERLHDALERAKQALAKGEQ
jgi:hypothetical protein